MIGRVSWFYCLLLLLLKLVYQLTIINQLPLLVYQLPLPIINS